MGCNSSKKKENQHVRQWDQEEGRGNGDTNASGRSANARNGDGTSFSRSTAQQSSTPRGIGSITNRESKENGQNIAFEDEFILSTSTQNRLKEHELMNAIITRSAGKFVDVNQPMHMLDDDDPFEISREFSFQVREGQIRPGDEMPPPELPHQTVVRPRDVIDVLGKRSLTTQERSDIDNIAYQLLDAISQVQPMNRGKNMVVKFNI